MASVGLPGTGNFVGEILVLIGLFKVSILTAVLATTGLILGAAYMLWLYRKVMFGELVKQDLKAMLDMSRREIMIFAPLVFFTLWMGIYPSTFLDFMHVSVENLITNHQAALAALAETVSH